MPSCLVAAEARTAVMVLAAVAFWGDDHCVGVHGLCTVVVIVPSKREKVRPHGGAFFVAQLACMVCSRTGLIFRPSCRNHSHMRRRR